jgi:hypothetical protein
VLARAASDGDVGVRALATAALGDLHDSLAVAPLLLALRDEAATVREAAADALGGFRARRGRAALESAVSIDASQAFAYDIVPPVLELMPAVRSPVAPVAPLPPGVVSPGTKALAGPSAATAGIARQMERTLQQTERVREQTERVREQTERALNPTIISVPAMAWAKPPPVSPSGTLDRVKKFQSSEPAPFMTSMTRIAARGRIASSAAL